MKSAFGIEHGISKAMSPNKAAAFGRMVKKPDLTSTEGVGRYGYASDKLSAATKGKRAKTAPKPANPGGWMSANNKIAHQGREASQRAKIFESRGRRRGTGRLP